VAAYLVAEITEVLDPAGLEQYRQGVPAVVEQYGGRYLAVGPAEQHEGEWSPGVLVIIEFPSMQRAREWHDADDYRALKELRMRCARTNLVFVDGV
jgi:uncharacterized protein (DUF1330 family)